MADELGLFVLLSPFVRGLCSLIFLAEAPTFPPLYAPVGALPIAFLLVHFYLLPLPSAIAILPPQRVLPTCLPSGGALFVASAAFPPISSDCAHSFCSWRIWTSRNCKKCR